MELRYESIAAESSAVADRVANFLGIGEAPSQARLRRAFAEFRINGIGRWSGEFGSAEHDVVEREAGGLLRRLGYSAERPSISPV